jgi:hypothetical protein
MIDPKTTPIWHDTIPVPKGAPVFLIMSFDAERLAALCSTATS